MMSVLAVTLIVSTCLLAFFVILFIREQSRPGRRGIDHESLLPLEDETPRVAAKGKKEAAQPRCSEPKGHHTRHASRIAEAAQPSGNACGHAPAKSDTSDASRITKPARPPGGGQEKG